MPQPKLLLEVFRLLGFQIGNHDPVQKFKSFAVPANLDGASQIASGGVYGQYVDLEGTAKNEAELVTRYKDMAMQPECEQAIEDIITDSIVQEDNRPAIQVNLEQIEQPENIKRSVREAFDEIMQLLNFNEDGMEIFRRWYVDGRLFYHIMIDPEDPEKGIQELRYLDPRRVRKIREIKKKLGEGGVEIIDAILEYYLYNERGIVNVESTTAVGVKIAKDSICYVHSGQIDSTRNMVVSYLHKAIKPLNQLRAMEDAHVIYRLSRAAERRVFYIDVGNMPTNRAEQYIKVIMNDFRNKLVYDSCFSMDTKVPLLDGRTLSLTEISDEFKTGKKLWTYSANPKTGAIVPGLITSAGVTRKNQDVMRLTFDNDKSVVCTLDHKFPIWDRGFVEAKDLVIGDSVIPFYTRDAPIYGGRKNSLYQQVYDNESKKWVYTHRMVSKWKDSNNILNETTFKDEYKDSKKQTVHHVNYNKLNNSPENLTKMNNFDHWNFHSQNIDRLREFSKLGTKALQEKLKDPEFHKKYCGAISNGFSLEAREAMRVRGSQLPKEHFVAMSKIGNINKWNKPNAKNEHSERQSIEYPQVLISLVKDCAKRYISVTETLKEINSNTEAIKNWKSLNSDKHIRGKGKKTFDCVKPQDLAKISKKLGCSGFRGLRDSLMYHNHKIIGIEYLSDKIDVGTIGIDGGEKYHNYHTFPLDCGVFTKNSTGEVRDDKKFLSMQEDFFLPRREGGRGTEVTTLPAGQNLGQIEDLNYFQERLYKALHVPTSRLKSDSGFGMGRSAEISRDEIKFSRFITKLRKRFDHLFKELLKIQLILKKVIDLDDWEEIREKIIFDYQKDSVFTEAKEQEIWTTRIDLLQQFDPGPVVDRYVTREWLKKNILRFTDDEIELLETGIKKEKPIADAEIEKTAALESGAFFDEPEVKPKPKKKQEKNNGKT